MATWRLGLDLVGLAASIAVDYEGSGKMSAYLLTGEPEIEKTTILKRILDVLGLERCGGFYTEELCAAGKRYGYRLVTLDGKIGMLADMAYNTVPLQVGKYGVVLPFLEDTALAAVSQALVFKSFVIIDEIGPMLMCSSLFQLVVMDVLTSSVPLIGTISVASDPWLDELKQRKDIQLFPVTNQNSDEIATTLIETLKSAAA
jgi:nucleoside-triphosphatase